MCFWEGMAAVRLAKLYVPCKSKEEASSIATALIEKRLVACANIFPVSSVYRWKGKVESANEHVLLLTTRKSLVGKAREAITKLHSYGVPAILEIPVLSANATYAGWVAGETSAGKVRA